MAGHDDEVSIGENSTKVPFEFLPCLFSFFLLLIYDFQCLSSRVNKSGKRCISVFVVPF